MIRRSTWVMLVIFALLLGAVWLMERSGKKQAGDATPTAGSQVLLDLQESVISELRVEDNAGKSVALGRDSQGIWVLKEPPAEATDVAQAESAVSQLLSLSVIGKLETPPPLSAVGLSPAVDTITLTMEDGSQKLVQVGNLTPTKSGYYVQVDGGPVSIVSQYGIEAFLKLLSSPPVLVTPTPTGAGTETGSPLSGTASPSPQPPSTQEPPATPSAP